MWDLVLASGTLSLGTTGVEFGLGSPTLVNLTKIVGTWKILKGLAKIMVGMVSPCILDVVHVWYCLIGSLVITHGLVTSALAGLIVQMNCK